MIHTIRQLEFMAGSTNGTSLRSVCGIYPNTSGTGPFCLVPDELKELSPRHISDRAIYATKVIFFHLIDGKILNTDGVKFIYKFPSFLMGKIFTFPRNALMYAGNYFSTLRTQFRYFSLLGKFALRFGEHLLFLFEKSRVLNFNSIGSGGERLKAHIKADSWFNQLFNRFVIHNTGKSDIPLIGSRSTNGTGFDYALNRSMGFDFNTTDLRELNHIFKEFEPRLWICERVVTILATEARITRFLARFDAPEKCTKRQIDSCRNILKALAESIVQKSILLFQLGKRFCLLISGKTFFVSFPGSFTLFKEMIVKPTISIKTLVKLCRLRLIREYPIFKCFTHYGYTIP